MENEQDNYDNDTDVAGQLDKQRISPESGKEIEQLREFLTDFVERARNAPDENKDIFDALTEWQKSVLENLPQYEIDDDESEAVERAYTVFPLEQTSGTQTYRVNVHIDNEFGSLIERVRRTTEMMLARVVAGRTACFVKTARRFGLENRWRRSRSLRFPHPLPYASPPPTTNDGKYTEEAGVIAAAFHFPLSLAAPGIRLEINCFRQGPSGRFWVLGEATVNLYNDRSFLRMKLNARAYSESGFSDNVWAGTIAHEIMHNLGWGHPDGGYDEAKAIVNYDLCVRRAAGLLKEDEIDDSKLIR